MLASIEPRFRAPLHRLKITNLQQFPAVLLLMPLKMCASGFKPAKSEQGATETAVRHHANHIIVEQFRLCEQRLAQLDRTSMLSSHPKVAPLTKDCLYLFSGSLICGSVQ